MKRLFCNSLFPKSVLRKSLFLCLILICTPKVKADPSYHFDYDPSVASIYQQITQLKLDQAKSTLKLAQTRNPYNLAYAHLASYIDFFTLFINENESLYDKLKSNREVYIDQVKKGPSTDPYYNFCQAEILLQWALIDLKFDHKFKGGKAIYDAYQLLEKNKKLFPEFINNNKSLSIIHVLAESVPGWVRKLLGIRGSISLGTKEIQRLKAYALSNPNYLFREEVAAINSYILFYQSNQKQKAIADLEAFNLDHTKSPLLVFLKASMALRSGDNERCLYYLNESPKGDPYADFYYLDFMKGRSLLYKLDENANKYILNYVQQFKGKHFIKEAYQKLAWHALAIENNVSLYKSYLEQCKRNGELLLDEDKQAQKEAESNKIPDPILLKSRILYDGGYHHQAYQTLIVEGGQIAKDDDFLLEYHYRLGRTLQALKNYNEALIHFSKVMDQGKSSPLYFACSSALQTGLIYEELKDLEKAKMYYNIALDITPGEYSTTLHQKAKSGLERIQEK
jgi:hypothetical protein